MSSTAANKFIVYFIGQDCPEEESLLLRVAGFVFVQLGF
jgi:hypothetical protein